MISFTEQDRGKDAEEVGVDAKEEQMEEDKEGKWQCMCGNACCSLKAIIWPSALWNVFRIQSKVIH